MIRVSYDEELHRRKEAEYNQQLGKEQGILEASENIALKMHENGMSNQQIITMTGLDQTTLDKIIK